MATLFKHTMVMVSDMQASVRFYTEGLGLRIKTQSPMWVELEAGDATIALHAAHDIPRAGSSPILSFYVDDVDSSLESLSRVGGRQEGRIREPSFGKVASMRAPEGTLVSLTQLLKNEDCPEGHGA